MKFPDFRDDAEMAQWFEKNDVDPDDLDVADDVVVAKNLTVSIIAEVYSVAGPSSGSPNVPTTLAGNRDFTPAIN
jgi:hypothetical protein